MDERSLVDLAVGEATRLLSAAERTLSPAPTDDGPLQDWYLDNLHRAVAAFADADPTSSVWTFSSREPASPTVEGDRELLAHWKALRR